MNFYIFTFLSCEKGRDMMNRYLIIALMILILPISQLTDGSHSHVSLDKANIVEHQSTLDLSYSQSGYTDKVIFFSIFSAIIIISLIQQRLRNFEVSSVIRRIQFTPIFYQSSYLGESPLTNIK
ncbi:hypothetical protein [Oceanobacillus sp. 1P07AA]|uniref:hypothetical protein n=1 Tax=Oceanobacillus sp. 1P07AA TaxID=3132293 RepID=UPI0039A4870B